MNNDKTVLVVVDVQNGFVGSRSRHVVPVIVDLVRRWQAGGGATIFSRYLNYPGSPYERLIGWTRMHGAPETDLVTELQPYAAKATAVSRRRSTACSTIKGLTSSPEAAGPTC